MQSKLSALNKILFTLYMIIW